ncbi:MAG: C-terminal binding protein [Bdellovibrio sp.]
MSKYLVGISDYVEVPEIERKAFPEAGFVYLDGEETALETNSKLQELDALLVWHSAITPQVASALKQCKIVVRYGVGFDNINIQALHDNKIPFSNTPDYGTEEVADTACAMILNYIRRINEYNAQAKKLDPKWQKYIPGIRRTKELVVGIVGVGRIGTAVMNRLRPFGVKLLGYDPNQPSGHEKAIGYQRAWTLNSLLEQSDIVSIHCPDNAQTRGMINETFLSKMKPGSALVNTARGKILKDLEVLKPFLVNGHLAHVALDVVPSEPPVENSVISGWLNDEEWIRNKFVLNPHTAFYSEEAWTEMRFKAAETARMYLIDGFLRNQVKP